MLIEKIASDAVLEEAFSWVCEKRAHYHHNGDIWHLRRWWSDIKPVLQAQLRSGSYRFRELRQIYGPERMIEWWSSHDALVLKAITLVLTEHLHPHLSRQCYHYAGTGGLKGAVRQVSQHLDEYSGLSRWIWRIYITASI